jgi:sodium-independent sulfate anion transporter 11
LVSPFEAVIWFAAVMVTVFSSIENGVYTSVGASLVLLLIRIAKPRGKWLGTVRVHYGPSTRTSDAQVSSRDVFVPLESKNDLRDPSIQVNPPPPGILIYRFEEAFTYPNANHLADIFMDKVRESTRPRATSAYKTRGDRPWNDPGPINPHLRGVAKILTCGLAKRKLEKAAENDYINDHTEDTRPLLKAIIFDFSSVSNVDTTSIQCLADVRQTVERYTGEHVDFYFASITSPWIRRGLLAAGFGTGKTTSHFTEVAPVIGSHGTYEDQRGANTRQRLPDEEAGSDADLTKDVNGDGITVVPQLTRRDTASSDEDISGKSSDVDHVNRGDGESQVSVPIIWNHDLTPFFHLDISAALAAATGQKAHYGN